MPHSLKSLTPNLIVADVGRSLAFYRDVLGFAVETTVPEAAPYVFAIMRAGDVRVFLNAPEPAVAEYPAFADRPIGGTLTLFIDVDDIHALHAELANKAPIVMPLEHKWYGVTEFAVSDPDGWVITFAQHDGEAPQA